MTRLARLGVVGLLCACVSACDPGGGTTPSSHVVTSAPSATPSTGVEYLWIHCGVKYAIFDGSNWTAESPIPAVPSTSNSGMGVTSNRLFLRGTMTRLSRDEAQFVGNDDTAGLTIRFDRFEDEVLGCA